tara:strand:+ start:378 stop:767 length:390 start_codon:yes stop_codon:yes gene_type:complete
MTEMTLGQLITSYIKIRDKKAEMVKGHKEDLKPYNEALMKLENKFQSEMNAADLDSLKTDGGTAYQAVQSSVTVADWEAFSGWVQEHKAWHFLDHRASKAAAEEYLEETGQLPPGLNRSSNIKVNVRRT